MQKVLFACTHNAGRSQMAAALFNALADPEKAYAVSAGTHPSATILPDVIAAMKEIGVALLEKKPQLLTPAVAEGAAFLVTMGCQETCPVVPGAAAEDWAVEDPEGKPLERVRAIRDEIREKVSALIRSNGWAQTPVLYPPAFPGKTGGGGILDASYE
jgi:arsenate reductase